MVLRTTSNPAPANCPYCCTAVVLLGTGLAMPVGTRSDSTVVWFEEQHTPGTIPMVEIRLSQV